MTKTITIAEIKNLEDIRVQLRQMESCSEASLDAVDDEVAVNAARGYKFYKDCIRRAARNYMKQIYLLERVSRQYVTSESF